MAKVFISSPDERAALARKLARDLEARGFETFLTTRDLKAFENFHAALGTAVSASDAFVVLVDPRLKRSQSLEREWIAILDEASDLKKSKRLIPVPIGEGELPNFLKNWQEVRLHDENDPKSWTRLVEKISGALQPAARLKFTSVNKADLERRNRRLDSIAEAARHLKSLGM
jgi:hypothetical protein